MKLWLFNSRTRVRDNAAAPRAPRSSINFVAGSGVVITVSDDAGNDETDVIISATGGGGGSGDMLKSVYDPNDDGVVTNAENVSRSVTGELSITGGGVLNADRLLRLVGDVASPGNSQYYGTNSSGSKGWHALPSGGSSVQSPTGVFESNGAALTAGLIGYVRVPYSGTITRWDIIADTSCTCVIDVWKLANARPVNADSITASAKPALTAQDTAFSTTLTEWATTVSAGDVIAFELESFTGAASAVTITLKVE
jgi:hypothetical protein